MGGCRFGVHNARLTIRPFRTRPLVAARVDRTGVGPDLGQACRSGGGGSSERRRHRSAPGHQRPRPQHASSTSQTQKVVFPAVSVGVFLPARSATARSTRSTTPRLGLRRRRRAHPAHRRRPRELPPSPRARRHPALSATAARRSARASDPPSGGRGGRRRAHATLTRRRRACDHPVRISGALAPEDRLRSLEPNASAWERRIAADYSPYFPRFGRSNWSQKRSFAGLSSDRGDRI